MKHGNHTRNHRAHRGPRGPFNDTFGHDHGHHPGHHHKHHAMKHFGGHDSGHGGGSGRGPFRGGPGMGGGMAGGMRGPGGRGAKRFTGDELRLLVLDLLDRNGPRHGYDLIKLFDEASEGGYKPSPGVLYPMLTLLADMDLVRESDDGNRRRSYEVTEAGRTLIGEQAETLARARERLAAMAMLAQRTDRGPVRRAMMNLRTAVLQRLSDERADEELLLDIAAELDRAASAIERLRR